MYPFQYKPIYNYITLKVNANIFLLITLSEKTNSIEYRKMGII